MFIIPLETTEVQASGRDPKQSERHGISEVYMVSAGSTSFLSHGLIIWVVKPLRDWVRLETLLVLEDMCSLKNITHGGIRAFFCEGRDAECSRDAETFALYKTLVSELLYWRIVARERNEKGIACCRSCATTDYQTYDGKFCLACFEEIDDPKFPNWVPGTLMRKERIRWIQEVQDGRRAEDISSAPDWWYTTRFLELDSTDHPQWYKDLNEYPDLDEEFRDLQELLEQGRKYGDFCWERKSAAAVANLDTTRKRSASHMDASESD